MLNKILPTNSGFTLVELLTVTSIMVMLSAVLVINLAGQRSARDLTIAANRLVSEIRKVQSYSLSGRTLPTGQSVQYYILKFDQGNPTQYTIQAMYDVSSQPKLVDIETIQLPPGVLIGSESARGLTIEKSINPTQLVVASGCALAAFAAPFGKIINNDGCSIPTGPFVDQTNPEDDYNKIISHQVNVACDGNNGDPPNPPICSASVDSVMKIKLISSDGDLSKKVRINGTTGLISFD